MLSIIIPVYNGEKYIERCITSVRDKVDKKNCEVIIVDDGSTDSTGNICKQMVNENIRYYHTDNQGVSKAREYGIKMSKGEWIFFLDADDVVSENIVDYIDKYGNRADWIIFSGTFKEIKYVDVNIKHNEIIKGIFRIESDYNGVYMNAVWSKAYKRNIIVANDIHFNENVFHGEDMLYNAEYCKHINYMVEINKSVYIYVQNNESATHKFQKNSIENDIRFLKEAKQYLDKNEIMKNEYRKIALNGLWIAMNQNIVHKENKDKYCDKIRRIKEITNKEPYKSSLKNTTEISSFRKIIFGLLRYKCFHLVFFILRIKSHIGARCVVSNNKTNKI